MAAPRRTSGLSLPLSLAEEASRRNFLPRNPDPVRDPWKPATGPVEKPDPGIGLPGKETGTRFVDQRIASPFSTRFRPRPHCRPFAHSSPVDVDVAGEPVFDVEAALDVLRLIESAQSNLRARGVFSSPAGRDKLLAL